MDPFAGTGPMAAAAKMWGCHYVGLDLDPDCEKYNKMHWGMFEAGQQLLDENRADQGLKLRTSIQKKSEIHSRCIIPRTPLTDVGKKKQRSSSSSSTDQSARKPKRLKYIDDEAEDDEALGDDEPESAQTKSDIEFIASEDEDQPDASEDEDQSEDSSEDTSDSDDDKPLSTLVSDT